MGDVKISGATYGFGMDGDTRNTLEKELPTGGILLDAARRAHVLASNEEVMLSGDGLAGVDFRGVKAAQSPYFIPVNSEGTFVAAELLKTGVEVAALFSHSAARVAEAATFQLGGGALSVAGAVNQVRVAIAEGEEQNEALKKDALQVAMVGVLDLPDGYRAKQMESRPDTLRNGTSPATRMAEQLDAMPGMKAVLQLRADEGMSTAQQFLRSAMPLDAYMASHQDLALRYHGDAAFRAGFDAMTWAHGAGPQEEAKAMQGLRSRDARLASGADQVWTA